MSTTETLTFNDPALAACVMQPEIPAFFWWQSGTLFNAQRVHQGEPSEVYTSTDLPDALDQAGYSRTCVGFVFGNQSAPDLENYQ